MYLEWGADLGIFGLTAGVAMIAIPLVQLARLRRYWRWRRPQYAAMAGAYSLAIIAFMGSAIFLHLSYVRYFFVLLALANAVIWVLTREREAFAPTQVPAKPVARPAHLPQQPTAAADA